MRFNRVFWGTQAFGGSLFDDTGRTILNEGGFANWLRWLRAAQDTPGVVLAWDVDVFRSSSAPFVIVAQRNLTRDIPSVW